MQHETSTINGFVESPARSSYEQLDAIFHPRSIAVAGASPNPMNQGNKYLRQLKELGFPGALYAINPAIKEVLGVPCYPSLGDVPGAVDYVISCVPADVVPDLVQDCIAKGVKALNLYTGRFAETGLEERVALEGQVVAAARRGGMRIIGPNCMGLYYPKEKITFRFDFPKESGPVAFIAQSGGHTVGLVSRGAGRGLRFSKIVSYGNAADVNESELLEYFAEDPETGAIGIYIEGVKDGPRFVRALRMAAQAKPVALLKGGRTAAGSRAVATHTASLAGELTLWDALCKQAGVVQVNSIQELADVLLAFQFLPPTTGRRVAVMGGGGGESVSGADACEAVGLSVPAFPMHVRDRFKESAPQVWSMIGNPLDGSATGGPEVFREVARVLASQEDIDLIIANTSNTWMLDHPENVPQLMANADATIKMAQEVGKPTALVVTATDALERWKREAVAELQSKCTQAGFPVFSSLEEAANAVSKLVAYYAHHATSSEQAVAGRRTP